MAGASSDTEAQLPSTRRAVHYLDDGTPYLVIKDDDIEGVALGAGVIDLSPHSTPVVEVARMQRQECLTLNLTDAPGMDLSGFGDVHDPTSVEITYRSEDDGAGQSDVTVMFGKINGHWPTRTYRHVTEARRPRPDWVRDLVHQHAPDWWEQP